MGEQLCETYRFAAARLKGTVTIAEFVDLEAAESGVANKQADLLLIECPAFFADTLTRVQQMIDGVDAVRAIVIYSFSRSDTVESTETRPSRITAIRAPISPKQLQVACAAAIALANRSARMALENAPEVRAAEDQIPARQFTDFQLAKIARLSPAIECECPHHLAGLLSALLGFEKYSAECENRNEADAEMHRYLHRTSAHARSIIEDSLKVLVELEGIDLDA